MVKAHIFISGLVQGVGFRHFTQRKAEGLGLVGWVRNLADGRVEAVFEGPKDRVEPMVQLCRKGPFGARIDKVKIETAEASGEFNSFEVH